MLRSLAKGKIDEEIWNNPGVHLTCRRFEDEVELLCWVLSLRGDQAVEVHWPQIKGHRNRASGRKTGQGEEPSTPEKRVYTPVGGCLGLASMGLTK